MNSSFRLGWMFICIARFGSIENHFQVDRFVIEKKNKLSTKQHLHLMVEIRWKQKQSFDSDNRILLIILGFIWFYTVHAAFLPWKYALTTSEYVIAALISNSNHLNDTNGLQHAHSWQSRGYFGNINTFLKTPFRVSQSKSPTQINVLTLSLVLRE